MIDELFIVTVKITQNKLVGGKPAFLVSDHKA